MSKISAVFDEKFYCLEKLEAPAYAKHGEEDDGAEDENHEDGEAFPRQQVVIFLHGDRVETHLHTGRSQVRVPIIEIYNINNPYLGLNMGKG